MRAIFPNLSCHFDLQQYFSTRTGEAEVGVVTTSSFWSDRYCDEACAEYPSAANSARGASVQRERVSEGGTTG
jgi:hypothetical protein